MRKGFLTIAIILLLMTVPLETRGADLDKPASSCTITEMYIAGVSAEEISHSLVIPRDWLEEGELIIEGEASSNTEKVEVTLDGGKSWHKAEGTTSWYYSFQPLPREKFKIGARAWCEGKPGRAYRRKFYKVSFTGKSSREIVDEKLRDIELFYQSKNRLQLMKLFSRWFRSPLYPNYRELNVQVRNDFQWGGAIQLHFYIDQVLRTGNIYIVHTHWDLTYPGLMEPKTGYTEFHFDAGDGWKIVDIRGDKPFGIIEEPRPDLYIVEDEILGNFPPGNEVGTVTVPVHNGGRIDVKKVEVKVFCKDRGVPGYPPSTDTATTTIKFIPIGGIRVVTLTLRAIGGFGIWYPPITCIITVDPRNKIQEINEENNRVKKVFQ